MSKKAFPAALFFFPVVIAGQGVARELELELPDWFDPVRAYLAGWVTWKDLAIALIAACGLSILVAAIYLWLIDSICELFKWPYPSLGVERTISVSLTIITFPFIVWAMLLIPHAVSSWNWDAHVFNAEQNEKLLPPRPAEIDSIIITLTPEEAAELFDSLEKPSQSNSNSAQPQRLRFDIDGNLIE